MKLKRFDEFINENKEVLLAPNGKPSNLNEFQYNQVRTPEFIEWFGDWINQPEKASKVVDENGEPMVVYHGTPNNFNVFKKEDKFRPWLGVRDYGIYFSDSIFTAKDYSHQNPDENKEYLDWCDKLDELKIKKDWDGWNELYFQGKDKYKPTPKSMLVKSGRIMECFLNIRKPFIKDANGRHWFSVLKNIINDSLRDVYDGIFCLNVIEVFKDVQNTYICFEPNQIKSATDNNGNFNKNNPNINETKKI